MAELKALKGNIVYAEKIGELTIVENGYIVTLDGIIQGVYQELPQEFTSAEIEDWGDAIITPSFSDLHIHGPQFAMVGTGMDLQLLEWLNTYAFPTESKYASEDYARMQYRRLAKALIERGTTRVCMFSSLHRKATNILMDELEAVGITGYVGKVNMDRNGGKNLQETTDESISETIRWIEENAERELIKPMITPRFTPSCTDELMAELGKISKKYGLPVQSHLSENTSEIEWVKELHPDCERYWESYDKYGLWKNDTIMAHCVYSDEVERAAMRDNGVWAIHCPDSNTNIASGIAPIRLMLKEGVKVAMGSDIAGGAKLSMMDAATDAIRMSRLRWLFSGKTEDFLNVPEAFYLITGAGQEYFGITPGFGKGDKLHAVIFDDSEISYEPVFTLAQRLERILYLGDRQCIKAVYSEGIRRV